MKKSKVDFWNRVAKKYYEKPIKNQSAYDYKLEKIRELLHQNSDVIELGCGTGSTALLLANDVRRYYALDFSDKMIEIARNQATAKDIHNVSFSVGNIETFNNSHNNKFDVVMAHSVLHLIDNVNPVLDDMVKALKPNGYIVFSLVLLSNLAFPLRWLLKFGQKIGLVPYLAFQSQEDLLEPLIKANFKTHITWEVDKRNIFVIVKKTSDYHD